MARLGSLILGIVMGMQAAWAVGYEFNMTVSPERPIVWQGNEAYLLLETIETFPCFGEIEIQAEVDDQNSIWVKTPVLEEVIGEISCQGFSLEAGYYFSLLQISELAIGNYSVRLDGFTVGTLYRVDKADWEEEFIYLSMPIKTMHAH